MNHLQIWCSLKGGASEREFAANVRELFGYLHEREHIEGYTLTRRAFVVAPPALGEFQITIDFADLAQLNRTFALMAEVGGEVESLHQAVREIVREINIAMYRDYPEKPKSQKTEKPK
jgi:hypothetical protein